MTLNQILQWLSSGDLRSDGLSSEVADFVLKNPKMFDDLILGVSEPDDVLRAHTADALEKIARSKPDLLEPHLTELINAARSDKVMAVKMHLAMIFGHLAVLKEHIDDLVSVLFYLLDDDYVFVRSWTISSLCIYARKYPAKHGVVLDEIVPMQNDSSIAIRTRVRYAMNILTDSNYPFPKGWIKSDHLQGI